MFKAVLFDLDGVITDTAEYHLELGKLWLKKLALMVLTANLMSN